MRLLLKLPQPELNTVRALISQEHIGHFTNWLVAVDGALQEAPAGARIPRKSSRCLCACHSCPSSAVCHGTRAKGEARGKTARTFMRWPQCPMSQDASLFQSIGFGATSVHQCSVELAARCADPCGLGVGSRTMAHKKLFNNGRAQGAVQIGHALVRGRCP